jgi:putative nucleotidyltransferase with HDIG domain
VTDTHKLGNQTEHARFVVSVPLKSAGKTIAIVVLPSTGKKVPSREEKQLLNTSGSQTGIAIENTLLLQKMNQLSTSICEMGEITPDMLAGASCDQVYALAAAVDARESYRYEHSRGVADVAEAIGNTVGLSGDELADLRGAALLHDIGKIGISDAILNKSDRLTPLEWEIVKKHSIDGAKIVSQIKKISSLAPLIRHHHEWYDGTGYPDGLKGQRIPLGSRIICIADAYYTMVSRRVYRSTMSQNEALTELERCSGTQFDPEIIKVVSTVLPQQTTTND